ncbi:MULTISPECIES: hypothetical protein [unclassified Streptomyces]|uniref:hypothetical protein n=1 Tax=unclassified Streptomyces TaxID=2593676 RepID=UPI000DC77C9D|nr:MULTISPECIES: hypothetical protein [unclassified Streptomyces]AWZ08808.1 hypothetical protein DRB89_34470 [Streptomyces sp. ICC4]AWZ14587.1 hypothetical protein DRB96_22595 [Streptomyces sp. ICC1]
MRGDRVRAVWWALSGRVRIAARGLLLAGVLPAAAWRLVQAGFTLTVLGGTAAVAILYRGAVYRPQLAPSGRAAGGALGGSPAARRPRGGHRARRLTGES